MSTFVGNEIFLGNEIFKCQSVQNIVSLKTVDTSGLAQEILEHHPEGVEKGGGGKHFMNQVISFKSSVQSFSIIC